MSSELKLGKLINKYKYAIGKTLYIDDNNV